MNELQGTADIEKQMNARTAEQHYKWRVTLGSMARKGPFRDGPVGFKGDSYGTIFRERQVITALKFGENGYPRPVYTHIDVGEGHYVPCSPLAVSEEHGLALYEAEEAFLDADGEPIREFPQFAERAPEPSQLCSVYGSVVLESKTYSRHCNERYEFLATGTVAVLWNAQKKETLHALVGTGINGGYIGQEVFDNSGAIAGIVIEQLAISPNRGPATGDEPLFLVFVPVNRTTPIFRALEEPSIVVDGQRRPTH